MVRRKPRRVAPKVAPGALQARRAVSALLKGLKIVEEYSGLALSSLDGVRQAAALARERQLAETAIRENLFDDLAALEGIFDGGIADSRFEPLRAVPSAVLRWAAAHLNLTPMLNPGEQRDIPADRISGYHWLGDPPIVRPGGLVSARVMTSGWKWRTEILAVPKLQKTES
jgi:hypothetical protein